MTWRGFRWASVQFATALLLLVTLGLGYLVLRPATSSNQHLAALPALEAPATPVTNEQGARTLAAITLPAGTVPSPIVGGLNHYTIPAGTNSGTGATWVSKCCHGPRFEYIASGSFTVRSAGPIELLRSGTSTWETLPAETEVAVTAGDALLLRLEDAFDAANSTSVPVELVEVVLIDTTVPGDPIPMGWLSHDQDLHTTSLAVPPVPATLRLQQTTLAPDTDLPLPPDALFQFAVSLEQGAYLVTGADFVLHNTGPLPVVAYVLTLVPASAGMAPTTASPEVPTGESAGTPSR